MPAPLSLLIAFGLIAGLAIVLRWTYGSDAAERRYRVYDEPAVPRHAGHPSAMVFDEPDGRHDALDPAPAEALLAETDPDDDRFGLLRTVVVATEVRQATLVRGMLRRAGVRATIAVEPDGVRVLVFPEALDRARQILR